MTRLLKYYKYHYIEVLHRTLYDRFYVHTDKLWEVKNPLTARQAYFYVCLYNYLVERNPNWRYFVHRNRTILTKAYNQKRLSFFFWPIFLKVRKRNYNRYNREPLTYFKNWNRL